MRTGRFEDFAAPEASFDLAVGNVPFAKVTPHDPRHNRGRHGLHNYFILKSLRLVRPGGLVAVLTSRYTLDARNPAARREMAGLADLVGAVRLPAAAFRESAGTEVVCDLVLLRRRPEGDEPAGPSWVATVPAPVEADGEELMVNELFAARPDLVVGRLAADRGMYRQRELTVEATGPLAEGLAAALDRVVAEAKARGATYVAAPARPDVDHPAEPTEEPGGPGAAQEGSIVVGPDGRLLHGTLGTYGDAGGP